MPQLNIHELETRADWPLLVTAVPCRTCEAQPGALCCDVGARKLSNQIITRADFHAERKYDAALAWLHRGEAVTAAPVTPVSLPPETSQPDDDTGSTLVDVAALVSEVVDSVITPTPELEPPPQEAAQELFDGGETGGAGAGGDYSDSGASDSADDPAVDSGVDNAS